MRVINNRFGVLLAKKRIKEKRRISLSEVAEKTGISRQSLQAWENNTVTRFDLPVMDALCTYFSCEPGDLFEYIPGMTNLEMDKIVRDVIKEVAEEDSQDK